MVPEKSTGSWVMMDNLERSCSRPTWDTSIPSISMRPPHFSVRRNSAATNDDLPNTPRITSLSIRYSKSKGQRWKVKDTMSNFSSHHYDTKWSLMCRCAVKQLLIHLGLYGLPDSLLRLWRYINHSLTHSLTHLLLQWKYKWQASTTTAEIVRPNNSTDQLFLVATDELAMNAIDYCDSMTSQKNLKSESKGVQVHPIAPAYRRPWCCKPTWSSSTNYADFLLGSDVERHAVENVRKVNAIAQLKVDELNSSRFRPLIGDTERLRYQSALLR